MTPQGNDRIFRYKEIKVMKEEEKELREKIAEEAREMITMALENCACLGRDAYGDYIEKMTNSIINSIKNKK